jgi:hypothetical protein
MWVEAIFLVPERFILRELFAVPEGHKGSNWSCVYACALTKRRKCHIFLTRPMHACPRHGLWATYIRLSHAKA